MSEIITDVETVGDMEDIRATAVGLTNRILAFEEKYAINMRAEIIAYFHEKLEEVYE